jgi:hypothetical protein
MTTGTTKRRRRLLAAVAVGLLGLSAATLISPASAGGQEWNGSVELGSECVDGEGVVLVDIFDDFSATYEVILYLGDDEVDFEGPVTDTDEGENTIEFGGLADGTYTVLVDWIEGFRFVFDGDVTVDCTPDQTSPSTSQVAPSSSVSAPAPTAAAAAAAATPRFTG